MYKIRFNFHELTLVPLFFIGFDNKFELNLFLYNFLDALG